MNGVPTTCSQTQRLLTLFAILITPTVAWSTELPDDFSTLPAFEQPVTNHVHDQLITHYTHWAGTRHRLGGSTTRGVDCSSFIQILFQEKFQLELPRSSREQMTVGERVDMTDLRSGDLLFFRTGPTRRHVGVYLGDNQFMHVSTHAGVEITKLFSPYWQRHFITARRVALGGALTPSN